MKQEQQTMRKINYHTHTQLCGHAGGTSADYIKKAAEHKLDCLGMSDHGPFPDNRHGSRMKFEMLDTYIEELKQLKQEYADRLTVYSGVEIEYDPAYADYYQWLLQKLDYLLLGQHFFQDKEQNLIDIYTIDQTGNTACYVEYANSVAEAMRSGLFSIVAHPDVIFINDFPWDDNCEKACEIIIRAAIDTSSILELNANGIRRGKRQYCDGKRYAYPHPAFWEKVAHTEIAVIVGSDCHSPDVVWDSNVEMAYQMARAWNLNLVDTFHYSK